MPRTLEIGFDNFHTRIKPSNAETQAATQHRATIKSSLEKLYTLDNFFKSGSAGNGTDIFYYSDVDYMAIIPTNQLKVNSTTLLVRVRDRLDATFPKTGVHIDTPAVVAPFGSNGIETTDIVPGDLRYTTASGDPVYEIADGDGGWLKTAPKAHSRYVTNVNMSCNYRVKPFIRFIKAWKYYNNVKVSSFYLEMKATKFANDSCVEYKTVFYLLDLLLFFRRLRDSQLSQLQDPTGIVGYIKACNTEAQRTDALSKINTAITQLENANDTEKAGNTKEAFEWLDKVFKGRFPDYYY